MHELGPQNPVWGNIKAAVCDTTQKTTPLADEFEMYNVTSDPLEEHNLAGDPMYSARSLSEYVCLKLYFTANMISETKYLCWINQ